MAKQSAVARLLSGLRNEYHDFKPSLQAFPDINPDRIARDLDLGREARTRGERNEPPFESDSMDEIELRVVDRIETHRNSAHDSMSEELRVYDQRLGALDFQERFNTIRTAAPAAVDEFMAEAMQGRNELFVRRRHVWECEVERDDFKATHRIKRVSQQAEGGLLTFKISVLFMLAFIEVVMNGSFLQKGNAGGLIGGIVEAIGFALLNVVGSYGIAWGGMRRINHRHWFSKLFGLASIIFYVGFVLILNLALAHYREVSGSLLEEGGREVVTRMMTNPFGLADMKSWLFGAMGVVFSLGAVVDALLTFDPYPGFGPLEKRMKAAHADYRRLYERLVGNLEVIRDRAIDSMSEASHDLALRRSEYDAILQGRSRLFQLFASHQNNLERAANTLLATYRETNGRHRAKETVPERFRRPYTMDRVPPPVNPAEAQDFEELKNKIDQAQSVLEEHQKQMHAEFQKALRSYKEIEDMFTGVEDAAQQPKLKVVA
ncbi:hypothetical protein [Microvirga sp. VF16]|uniref:hypothetical protein n=1 Tax=Microvirga sp. VF16 TaxID=2807101 RepID=UPI00193E2049|nr:hypothetical protein [Microvirga sp. VF16]QRM35447.1 hypothetical protein JO965_44720 [Microvirga sp. VF16]